MRSPRNVQDLPTPALLLDGNAARRNITTASALVASSPARLRPHFKSHKCPQLARAQIEGGNCVGLTAATVAEAEALVDHGFDDVLIANQVVGAEKVRQVARLAARANIRAAFDSPESAEGMAAEARRQGVTVGALVEIEIGHGRWGVAPGPPVLALARQIADLGGLRFDGLQAYHGSGGFLASAGERDDYSRRTTANADSARQLLEENGLPCPIVSGAGTGTFQAILSAGTMTEFQLGSYVLMDWLFQERLGSVFEIALTVLSTVISVSGDRFVLDVGLKGLGNKAGPPRIPELSAYEVVQYAAEEHTVVRAPNHRLAVGQRLRLVPGHAGGTANLYRQMVVHEGEAIVALWPIVATGYDLNTWPHP